MTVVFVLAVCLLFAINFSAYRYASAESEDLNPSLDWKFAIRKIKELENRIKVQDERIATLEKRPLDEEWKSVINLQKTVQKQNDRINQLEARIYELEGIVKDENIESVQTKSPTNVSETNHSTLRSNKSMIRKERLLLQPTTIPVESVAFFARFSSNIPAGTNHHILVFDKVITNAGNAYHSHTGTFIAPRSGLYVFTWTIRLYGTFHHSTELLVNNNVVNVIYLHPANTIDGSVTGTAVVHVNQGDDAFIRTGTINEGDIATNVNGYSSFAGWILT